MAFQLDKDGLSYGKIVIVHEDYINIIRPEGSRPMITLSKTQFKQLLAGVSIETAERFVEN